VSKRGIVRIISGEMDVKSAKIKGSHSFSLPKNIESKDFVNQGISVYSLHK
jgi:hypothetical protein